MLVYMASGRVVNIMLKAGKLAETAYRLLPRLQALSNTILRRHK